MELKLKGKHLFDLIRLVNKMDIKMELVDYFKQYTGNVNKKKAAAIKLKIALGEKENNAENVNLVLAENEELKNEFVAVQETSRELIADVAFFVMGKIADGEKDIVKLLASMYEITEEDFNNLSFVEMVECIKNIFKNEEIKTGFLSLFK